MSGGYDHPLAGRSVTITREGPHHGRTFTVRRVIGSRFGGLAVDDAEPTTAWSVADVEVVGCVRCGTEDTGRFEQYGEVVEVAATACGRVLIVAGQSPTTTGASVTST